MQAGHFMPFVVTGDLQCGERHNETLEDALFITCGYHMCSDIKVVFWLRQTFALRTLLTC